MSSTTLQTPAQNPGAPAAPGFFSKYKRGIGAILGIVVLVAVWIMPAVHNLPRNGQQALALGLFTVIWWAFGVIHPGYTAIILLAGWNATKTATLPQTFAIWSSPLAWLAIGGFLIAAAVEGSGLGKRIGYFVLDNFVKGYGSIIFACFILQVILSILIPQPWPRSLIIMSVMAVVIHAAKLERKHAIQVGFAVFAASIPSSMIFLTGDATLNPLATSFAHADISYVKWLGYMGVPGVIACVLTYLLHRLMFRGPAKITINRDEIHVQRTALGKVTRKEWTVLFWVGLAIIMWITDFLHHINPSWIALGCAAGLALPWIGDVLNF